MARNQVAPQSDDIRALRAVVRERDDLVAARVQLANPLRSLHQSF
jgi:transposase